MTTDPHGIHENEIFTEVRRAHSESEPELGVVLFLRSFFFFSLNKNVKEIPSGNKPFCASFPSSPYARDVVHRHFHDDYVSSFSPHHPNQPVNGV